MHGKSIAVLLISPCIVALSILAGQRATAEPPPPSFWDFEISNTTGDAVVDLVVRLYPTASPGHAEFVEPIELRIPRLPDGKTINLGSLGSWGISKITVSDAKCPGLLQHPVEIVAEKRDFDGQPGEEYAGFCPAGPNNEQSQPKLEFRKAGPGPQNEAHLHARWRWGDEWAPAEVVHTVPFNP